MSQYKPAKQNKGINLTEEERVYLLPKHAYFFHREDWMDDASCRGRIDLHPKIFGERGRNTSKEIIRMCEECPVRWECLRYACEYNIKEGIFGGFTPDDRKTFYKKEKLKRLAYENIMSRSREDDWSSGSTDSRETA